MHRDCGRSSAAAGDAAAVDAVEHNVIERSAVDGDAVEGDAVSRVMPGGSNTAPGAVASVSAGAQGLVRCARYAAIMWIYCTIGGYVRTLSRRARGGGALELDAVSRVMP